MAKKYKSFIADNIQVKDGGSPAWNVISRMTKLKFTDKDKTAAITFVDGTEELNKVGQQLVLRAELSDQDLATLQHLNALSGEAKPIYIDFGKVNGKYQEFYAPECAIFKDTDWESPTGGGLMNAIIIQPVKQSSAVSVTPSTGLPTGAHSHSTSDPQTSDNNYFIIIET